MLLPPSFITPYIKILYGTLVYSINYCVEISTKITQQISRTFKNTPILACAHVHASLMGGTKKKGIDKMNRFKQCDTPKFTNSNLFVTHIYSMQDCYYHRIIMRIIQGTYSPLVSKLKIKETQKMDKGKMKSVLHDKKVILPPHIESMYNYESYKFER